MQRSAFTLMELLVSVALIALITVFMYGAIASSKLSGKVLGRHSEKEHNRTMIYSLLYLDLFESLSLKTAPTKDKHFTLVQMQTNNSLYDVAAPHVTYYVDSQTNSLMRLEAARKIMLPVMYEQRHAIHADVILTEVSDFNLYAGLKDTNATAAANDFEANEESLSSEEDKNVTTAAATSGPSRYLLYINGKSLSEPLLLEIAR